MFELKTKILYYQNLYYNLNYSEVPDSEYDKLIKELICLENKYPNYLDNNSPTQIVSSLKDSNFKKIKHLSSMLSLDNVFDKFKYVKFHQNLSIKFEDFNVNFCCELKFDGLAINLIYKKGILFTASTRGNGIYGEDITDNALTIKSIPKELKGDNIPSLIEIRGEIFMMRDDFINLNKDRDINKKFSNPRNAASGSLRQKDALITSKRNLHFICHSYGVWHGDLIPSSHYDCLNKISSWGIPISNYNSIFQKTEEILNFYDKILNKRSSLQFDIDGIVIKLNELKLQKKIGNTNKFPKWAISFKFPAKEKLTQVKNVIFNVGRTGVITPVACLQPIYISGVKISYASLHSIKEIQRLDLYINDFVNIRRAGDVIPQIVNVVKSYRSNNNIIKISIPKNCFFCGSKLFTLYKKSILKCSGQLICSAQLKKSIKHFVSKSAFNILGLGEKIINKLVDGRYIKDIADLFYLNIDILSSIYKIASKNSFNIINSINKSRRIELHKLIYAFGIHEVGDVLSFNLSKNFISISNFMAADFNTLVSVHGVGKRTANNIINFFQSNKNINVINKLFKQITVYDHKTNYEYSIFYNKSIVFSGLFYKINRILLKEKLINLGARVNSNISYKTDFLIIGKSKSNKIILAKKLNIKILNEDEIIRFLD
ncbi:NAD-dependent DNA ligase LigA [Buchnera aphidicola (Neophyllaphis podocarpi)]|uniref:NAD-dependent DNA ligase LigA n=1 Tax=Buchnera aphidicola TaxID=9 RepID=UPI0031B88731